MDGFFPTRNYQCNFGRLGSIFLILLSLTTNGCMTYRVDSLADAVDANPGDEKCARAVIPGSETAEPVVCAPYAQQ